MRNNSATEERNHLDLNHHGPTNPIVTSIPVTALPLQKTATCHLLIGPLSQPAILDLQELKLVDRDVVAYLRLCEANGIELRNCPPYIREWILAENDNGTSHEPE